MAVLGEHVSVAEWIGGAVIFGRSAAVRSREQQRPLSGSQPPPAS